MRALALVVIVALVAVASAEPRRDPRVPAAGRYRFAFHYSTPDMRVNRVAAGTYAGVIVVEPDGTVAISKDEAGAVIGYRGPLTRFIPWQRHLRIVLMAHQKVALYDERELLYGCGADEGGNGYPCVESLERAR